MTTIAKGVVQIDGKDNTKKAFDSAKKSALTLEKAMKAVAAAIALAAGAKAMGKMITSTLDLADSIGKLSTNTGISVEFIQTYTRVMGEAGVSQAQADKSLLTFSKRLGEMKGGYGAMLGPISKYDEALVKQLQSAKDSEEGVKILIAALERMEDPAQKAAIASAAFGTQVGKEMPAMLAQGAGSFDAAAKDILKTVTLMDEGQIRMAEKANDMMGRVSDAWGSMKTAIVVNAAGPIVEAMEWILETAYPAWKEFTQGIGEAWDKYAKPGIDALLNAFDAMWPYLEPVISTMVRAIEIQFAVIGKVWEIVQPGIKKFTDLMVGVWDVVGEPVMAGVNLIGNAFGLILGFVNDALDAVQSWVDGTTSLLGAAGAIWDSWVATVQAAVKLFTGAFDGLYEPIKSALDAVWSVIDSVVGKIKEKFEWVANALGKVWDSITGIFKKGGKEAVKETEDMTKGVVKSTSKLAEGVDNEVKKMEQKTYPRFKRFRKNINDEGEGIVHDAVGNSWAKDWSILVPQAFEKGSEQSIAAVKELHDKTTAYGDSTTTAYINSLNTVVVTTDEAFSEVEDRANQLKDEVEGSMADMFVDFLNGDIEDGLKGFFDRLVDIAKKAAADMAAEFVMNKLFGGLGGGGGSGAGILGGLFKGGGGGASGLFSKVGGLFKGGSAAGSAGWTSGITAPGAGGGAATAGGVGGMAAAAVPLAIFGFGMYMSKKQAKKDKENYLKIINDIELAENLATENIAEGYNLLGQRGENAFVQIDEATGKHMETMNIGAERVSKVTDEYGNVIMKAQEFDAFTKDVQWAEMHMDVVDSLKEINSHYGELGVHGQEATLQIQMATQALINDQQMSVKMTEAMADGYISAGEAMELGLASAAGLTSEEFKKVVDGSNAIVTGVNKMSAESLKAFSQIDTSSGMAAAALSDGFVSSLDMSRMGFSELGAMSSDMFHSMIQYAQQATSSMNGLANAAGNAGGAARGVPGFMTGGSFMVGGKGGLDNNIVAFKASNNERVTVETPAQQRTNDSRGGGFSAVDVNDLIEFVTKPIVGAVQKQSVIAAANARH